MADQDIEEVVDLTTTCYCCTCTYDEIYDHLVGWDAACHLHGAHGMRGCQRHNIPAQSCDCGCQKD